MNNTLKLASFDYDFMIFAIIVWLLGGFILSAVVKKELAFALMFIKVAIVVVHFTFFADGGWFYGGDDQSYFGRGIELLQTGRSPLDIWSHPTALYLAQTRDSLWYFYLYNYFAVYLIGPYYYSPVLFNLLCSVLTVVFLARLVQPFSKNRQYVTFFVIFASIHWMTLAWTSFLDLKGPLVSCLMALALLGLARVPQNWFRNLLFVFASFAIFSKVRFYFPGIILAGYVAAMSFEYKSWLLRRKGIVLVSLLPIVGIGLFILKRQVGLFLDLANFERFPYEALHFILQPIPWNITSATSYLLLPAILHWVFFVPGLIGAALLWKRHRTGKQICATLLVGVGFYGVISLIASTRHRFPFDMLFIILQYHFLWAAFGPEKRLRSPAAESSGSRQVGPTRFDS
jgi:hypothetical protein